MTDTSLVPATRAVEHLSDAIRFGRSAEHPGLADVVDRAGYAIAGLRDTLLPVIRGAALEVAHGEAPFPATGFIEERAEA